MSTQPCSPPLVFHTPSYRNLKNLKKDGKTTISRRFSPAASVLPIKQPPLGLLQGGL